MGISKRNPRGNFNWQYRMLRRREGCCGSEPPPPCYCYTVTSVSGTCNFQYISCENNQITDATSDVDPIYICARENSVIALCDPGNSISITGGTVPCSYDDDCKPLPPRCYCGTFQYRGAGAAPVDVKGITINGGTSYVYTAPDIFDPAWPADLATYLNGIYPETDIEVNIEQINPFEFRICVLNVNQPFTFTSIDLGQNIGTVFFSVDPLCSGQNRGPLVMRFSDTSELASIGINPALATALDWSLVITGGPSVFTYVNWDPVTFTVELYGNIVESQFFPSNFLGFTTLEYVSDDAGYYVFLDVNCFGSCINLVYADFPSVVIVGSLCFTETSLGYLNLPKCTDLGGSPGDDGVFLLITPTLTGLGITQFTLNVALLTNNVGSSPDGDVVYIQTTYPAISLTFTI